MKNLRIIDIKTINNSEYDFLIINNYNLTNIHNLIQSCFV